MEARDRPCQTRSESFGQRRGRIRLTSSVDELRLRFLGAVFARRRRRREEDGQSPVMLDLLRALLVLAEDAEEGVVRVGLVGDVSHRVGGESLSEIVHVQVECKSEHSVVASSRPQGPVFYSSSFSLVRAVLGFRASMRVTFEDHLLRRKKELALREKCFLEGLHWL